MAATLYDKSNSHQGDDVSEVWTIPETSKTPNSSTTGACESDLRSDCTEEQTVYTGSTFCDVQDDFKDTLDSKISSHELLESKDRSASLSEAADRDVVSEMTDSRDKDVRSDIDISASPRRKSTILSRDEERRYEVEKILDHDERDGSISYHVKWLGWPEKRMTWEPAKNFKDCPKVIEEYWTSVKSRDSANNTTNTEGHSSPPSEQTCDDDEDRYEVEKIVDHDEHDGLLRYHIQWLGYPEEDRTWEPAIHLDDCSELMEEYWNSLKECDSVDNIANKGDLSTPSSG